MARKTISQYNKDAERLANRFPNLKKLQKRKRLKPSEKAQITRSDNIARIMRENVADRPEKYRGYRFPVERHPPTSFYKSGARRIAKFTKDPEKYREYGKAAHKLTGAEKAAIRKKLDLLKFTENVFSLTPAQARKLPESALIHSRNQKGQTIAKLNAIKLRNTADGRILNISNDGVLTVRSSGRKWFYIPTGADQAALAAAAETAFAAGAIQVYFWTVHGRVGGGSEDMADFLFKLGQKYMSYLSETERQGQSTDWLIGIAWTKNKGRKGRGQ